MFCDYIRVFLNKVADLPLMLPPLIDITLFQQAINDDRLIITPNHRLAAKLLKPGEFIADQLSGYGTHLGFFLSTIG